MRVLACGFWLVMLVLASMGLEKLMGESSFLIGFMFGLVTTFIAAFVFEWF